MEDCFRMVDVFERRTKSGSKGVSGLIKTREAIRRGEPVLVVSNVSGHDMRLLAEELKSNTSLLWLGFSCE